jgi:hypothetical protein
LDFKPQKGCQRWLDRLPSTKSFRAQWDRQRYFSTG